MNDRYTRVRRMLKALAAGVSAGAVVLCAFIAPAAVRERADAAAAAIRQENLLASGGAAADAFSMGAVSLTVLLDGEPHGGMSVAADRGFYTVPQNGVVSLSLAPNSYQFTAGFENRKLVFSGEVYAETANAFVLDVGKTPSAPELRICDVPESGAFTVPLDITNADEVMADNLPAGAAIAKQNREYILSLDCSALSPGFSCIRLTAENQYGQAVMYVGLKKPRGAVMPVYTAEDLRAVRNNLSGYYVLMNDIDMSGIDDWTPIGTITYPFTGLFDGGGHELSGFHAPARISDSEQFALFGVVKNAELKNVIFRDPLIAAEVPSRELGLEFKSGALASSAYDSLIESCAVLGGIVSPSDGNAGGLLHGATGSVIIGCFNSAEIFGNMQNRYLPNTGGILGGADRSYVTLCANEGSVKGNHLTGGISGYANVADITRCVNSGYIWGSTIVGAVPVGGIVQSNDYGRAGYSYFVRGESGIGAHCGGGVVTSVIPIPAEALRAAERLTMLGSFGSGAPDWAYASLDARGPVPYGIFKERAAPPDISQTGRTVTLPPMDGVRYFYTLDGSDPYSSCENPADTLSLTLKEGQTLTVFAAQKGCRDSEIITVTGGR